MAKLILIAAFACLTIVSGARAQEYDWHITYPPPDSAKYAYSFVAVDCRGTVCTAVGNKQTPSIKTIDRNVPMTFRSEDGGLTWREQDPGLPHCKSDAARPTLWEVQQIDSLTAFAAGDSGIVIKTTDGGNTWQRQNLHSYGRVWAISFADPMTGIVAKTGAGAGDTINILTTHDGGTTWTPCLFVPWLYANECHSEGGESFVAIGYGGDDLYYTHDNWKTIDSTPYIVPVPDTVHIIVQCNFIGADTLVACGGARSGGVPYLYLIRSVDGGEKWTQIDIPDNIVFPRSMSSLDSGLVFLGGSTDGHQMVISRDHGVTWDIEPFAFDADTIPQVVYSVVLTANNNTVGIFGDGLEGFDASVLAHGVPISLSVAPTLAIDTGILVYPNPAAESVTVTSSFGQFSIIDPLGRSYEARQTGNTLDVSSLPSGVYFVSDGRSRAKFIKE